MKDFPEVGSMAPDFTLPDQNGQEHTLSAYKGRWVLLYFYPKDDTAGCTKEACAIREVFPDFKKLNAVVFGISVDSVESHKKFAEKYSLPFILLADVHKKVVNDYGVWETKEYVGREESRTNRISFLVDPLGEIEKIYENVHPEKHAQEVLEDLGKIEE